MDLLFWKHQNPNIKDDPTRKQYYGKFCYRLVLKAFGGRVINDDATVTESINYRIATARNRNYGGSWRYNPVNDLLKANIPLLEELKSIKNGYGKRIKIRIEEPWVQIYAKDEDTLKDIAKRFDDNCKSALEIISTPESPEHQAYLESDCILVKKSNGYQYKVFLRDGDYSVETKKNLFSYLTSLGDEVKVPASTATQLITDFSWIWGCYYYVNDLSINTALALICPGLIGKIHELKIVEQ